MVVISLALCEANLSVLVLKLAALDASTVACWYVSAPASFEDERPTTSPLPRTSSFSSLENRSGVTSRCDAVSYSSSPAAGVGSKMS